MKRPRAVRIVLALTLMCTAVSSTGHTADEQPEWRPTFPTLPRSTHAVSLFDSGRGYVSISDGGNALLRTDDFGMTYRPVTRPNYEQASGLERFVDETTGYGVGNGRVFRTTDGAQSWEALASPASGGFPELLKFDVVEDGPSLFVGAVVHDRPDDFCEDPGEHPLQMFASTDGGTSWEPRATFGFNALIVSMDMLDGEHGILIVVPLAHTQTGECEWTGELDEQIGEHVYATNDGWRTFFDVTRCNVLCTSVAIASAQRFLIGHADGSVTLTPDAGTTFHNTKFPALVEPPEDHSLIYWVSALEFAGSETAYALGNGRGIWRSDDGGLHWTRERSIHVAYGLGNADFGVAGNHAIAAGPATLSTRVL